MQKPSHKRLYMNLMDIKSYKPEGLLDAVMEQHSLKNDAALAKTLMLTPPVISKLRSKRAPISASVLLRIHDVTGMSIATMRNFMGVPSPSGTQAR